MNPDTVIRFTELAFQYGPFFFAILFLLIIARWAYRISKETASRTNPAASKKDLAVARGLFVASFVVGVVLVGAAVVWWLGYRPTIFVYRGTIRDLQDYEVVASDSLYFRSEPKPTIDDIPLRNEHFVMIQESPFKQGQLFDVEFSKGRAKRDRFQIPYDLSDACPKFTIQWDDKTGTNVLRKEPTINAQTALKWIVHAAQQQVTVSRGKDKGVPARAAEGLSTRQPNIEALQDARSDVGAKITALEELNRIPIAALNENLKANTRSEPVLATIMDLTRHSDKEVSYKAKQVLNRIHVDEYLVQQLQSPNKTDRANAEKVLFKLDKAEAMKVSNRLGPTRSSELASRLESRGNALQVLPTASPQGDRYYLKATWDPSNPSVVECLTGLFSRELISNRSLDQERSLMRNRRERLVYWYDKEWSVDMSRQIKSCGATATFVHAPSAR